MLVMLMALLTITSMNVHYGYSSVTVAINYSLNDIQRLGVILFGAGDIEHDVTALFESTNYTLVRVDDHHAVFRFPVKEFEGYVYFPGVKLKNNVTMTLEFPNNVTLNITGDEIPAVYLFR